jgi:hypothetical protein
MFSVARAHAPCVIFIDEVEPIVEFGEFLTQVDGRCFAKFWTKMYIGLRDQGAREKMKHFIDKLVHFKFNFADWEMQEVRK